MYAIVEFKVNREVEVVPCTWLNGSSGFWPNVASDKAVKLVRKGEPPGAGFSEFEVNVKALFSEYIAYIYVGGRVQFFFSNYRDV